MIRPGEWRCALDDLPPGTTATFRLTCAARTVHGFALNREGRAFAYVNSCPHVGTSLDLWPNEFLSEDGSIIVCSTHGALFEPATGDCIAGPCAGDRLTPLPVRMEGQDIVVSCGEA